MVKKNIFLYKHASNVIRNNCHFYAHFHKTLSLMLHTLVSTICYWKVSYNQIICGLIIGIYFFKCCFIKAELLLISPIIHGVLNAAILQSWVETTTTPPPFNHIFLDLDEFHFNLINKWRSHEK